MYYANKKLGLNIHSFVLMPNHFHLQASLTDFPIGNIMREFLTNTSKELNWYSRKINQNWGSKYFKCELTSTHYFLNTYKYVYQNPLRAGLVNKCEDWKYSTLNGLLGFSKLIIPLQEDTILFNPNFDEKELAWLNKNINEKDCSAMRIALSKKQFQLPKTASKKLFHLEHDRI